MLLAAELDGVQYLSLYLLYLGPSSIRKINPTGEEGGQEEENSLLKRNLEKSPMNLERGTILRDT